MNSDELRNWATVIAAGVALLVFIVNSFLHIRNQRIENVSRFFQAHQRLFADGTYLALNIPAIDAGVLRRDHGDERMEAKFHLMMLEIERLAILANNHAVPRTTQVYMLGWYTQHVLTVITEEDRNNMFWELAIGYLDRLAKDTTAYERLTHDQRQRYWR